MSVMPIWWVKIEYNLGEYSCMVGTDSHGEHILSTSYN